jgi:hypothetical protein
MTAARPLETTSTGLRTQNDSVTSPFRNSRVDSGLRATGGACTGVVGVGDVAGGDVLAGVGADFVANGGFDWSGDGSSPLVAVRTMAPIAAATTPGDRDPRRADRYVISASPAKVVHLRYVTAHGRVAKAFANGHQPSQVASPANWTCSSRTRDRAAARHLDHRPPAKRGGGFRAHRTYTEEAESAATRIVGRVHAAG